MNTGDHGYLSIPIRTDPPYSIANHFDRGSTQRPTVFPQCSRRRSWWMLGETEMPQCFWTNRITIALGLSAPRKLARNGVLGNDDRIYCRPHGNDLTLAYRD